MSGLCQALDCDQHLAFHDESNAVEHLPGWRERFSLVLLQQWILNTGYFIPFWNLNARQPFDIGLDIEFQQETSRITNAIATAHRLLKGGMKVNLSVSQMMQKGTCPFGNF